MEFSYYFPASLIPDMINIINCEVDSDLFQFSVRLRSIIH